MLDYIQVHCARKVEWIYTFLCLEYKRKDIWGIFEKYLGQNLKKSLLPAFQWVCYNTHVIWETHFWEEWIEEKRKCCCGGRFVGNELEEWPRVSFLSPWLPKLWDGNVFVVEIKIRRAVCMGWKIQSRTFWRKKNVQKICNVQCLPNIYSKLICLILIVVN